MTSATLTAPRTFRVTLPRVIRSEWTKFRTLQSTMWSLLAVLVLILGFSALVPSIVLAHWPPHNAHEALRFEPTGASLAGTGLAQIALGVLGVMCISGEYATGMIRASLAAVPTRIPMLIAKVIVFATAALALVVPAVYAAFFIGQSILAGKHIDTTISSPGVSRVVIGTALYITGVGILGLVLGALLRHTAGAIASLFAILLVIPGIVRLLPSDIGDPINKWLPSTLGGTITELHPDSTLFAPWTGFAIFCGYLVAGLVLAGIMLRRRDA